MGLMQKGVETYDAMSHLAGIQVEGKQPLAPIGHIITSASIEVTINNEGEFVNAKNIDKKVVIPCTEDSASRTSKNVAHPLCDQIKYIAGKDDARFALYLEAVEKWAQSEYGHDKVKAIYSYIKRKSLITDLINVGVSIKEDAMVVWNVIGLGYESGTVYNDTSLHKAYERYYISKVMSDGSRTSDYCMVTGNNGIITEKHLKGIVAFNGNAKVISSNDNKNYSFRGKFKDANEAYSVSYIASQKAHNALKWVIANDGITIGNRVCVCWNPSGIKLPKLNERFSFDDDNGSSTPSEYKKRFEEKIRGYKRKLPEEEDVVIAMFDAATSGRLAITYYKELSGSDFIDRIASWDETTSFPTMQYGISTPLIKDYVNFAFGTYRGEHFVTDDKVFKQHMQRMLICRVENRHMPPDIVKNLVKNSERLSLYNRKTREKLLHITCASIKKRYEDKNKEVISMSLEKEKKDRSYQYGRLLAIMEKMERDTYARGEDKRETNAIRSQHMFVQRPLSGFSWIMEKLQQSYCRKLPEGLKIYYDKLIQDIVDIISECDDGYDDKPLTEMYLIGYYLQKKELYTKAQVKILENDKNEE